MTTDLRDRLRAAMRQPTRSKDELRQANVTQLPDLSGLGGHWFESPEGPGYVIESRYEAGHEHGAIPLHNALSIETKALAKQAKEPRLSDCDPSGFLYFDTETTGLAGAGVMVFLAGTAKFEGSTVVLRQYLLPAPNFEGGLLGGLAKDLAGAGALVSYNGKSFDIPVLENRYILSRMRPTFRSLPHLDLLHPNRRLFRGTFDSHKLTRMEVELLGFVREQDCPSAEVPERYFKFQRSGDPTHILPVLRHNAWDILSLVALTAHLADVCDGGFHPLQSARAARFAEDYPTAASHYESAVDTSGGKAERLEAMEGAARCRAKTGDYQAAATWWRRLIDEPRARRITPYVELAKILEHRDKDFAEAFTLVDIAAESVRQGLMRSGAASGGTSLAALEHRLERLRRKLG
jgi:uncharacterized protein